MIRSLFDEYIQMYATRDDRLTSRFSKNFSGFAGGGTRLVKDVGQWIDITRQDFAQITEPLRIEMLDVSLRICVVRSLPLRQRTFICQSLTTSSLGRLRG